MIDLKQMLGLEQGRSVSPSREELSLVINLKLLANGLPMSGSAYQPQLLDHVGDLIRKLQEQFREHAENHCSLDARIQSFIDRNFADTHMADRLRIPLKTFHLDFHGLARELSLPRDKDEYIGEYVRSYRLKQGVLHNPASDRRTTKGTFHVSEGGLPIAGDKLTVPKTAFANLLWEALHPPASLMELPYTSTQTQKGAIFTSLYLRPLVSPEVPGLYPAKNMEIRFLAPGSLVSNLDFVESIFGNAGDAYLPENDAALDIEHFSGVTGCVILAPHLTKLRKKDLGLPHAKDATAKQKVDGMCWEKEDELYNNGQAFKATFRTVEGVMLTLIADNYFGYCKKEVKTQISFASNLLGLSEEEHAGGALVFPSYSLGDTFTKNAYISREGHNLADMQRLYGDAIDFKPEGYGIDRKYKSVVYLPEDAEIQLLDQRISWTKGGQEQTLRLLPEHTYMYPTGYKVRMEKHPGAPSWRLIGTIPEGTLFHKPATVSGGGKSEISKSIADSILYKSFYIRDFEKDFEEAEKIVRMDFTHRFSDVKAEGDSRPLLSPERSLGSVVKLLTPGPEYSDHYNKWLADLPNTVRFLVFIIKRFYKPEWGDDIRSHFSVDIMDGRLGNELHYRHRKLVSGYLRVGTDPANLWQVFRLRVDYVPSDKLQFEDDISVSITVPASNVPHLNPHFRNPGAKFVQNCEYRLFQRPDDVVHKGYDGQSERELSDPNVFISNFEPLTAADASAIYQDAIEFDKFTEPMKNLIREAVDMPEGRYFVCSANPRLVNGKPSPNIRYLQNRQDLADSRSFHVAEMGMRLRRKVPADAHVPTPVNSVIIGRRNNPIDRHLGIKPLAVYNPLHYQELPELFMELIASLTGKSPSTTGAGSEAALTKGPFNALRFAADLNNALVSYILTGYQVFSIPAGHIGSQYRIEHDLSMLIPEVWARMSADERDAGFLIDGGYLKKVEDFEYQGRKVEAGRLGYRISERFLHLFFGRIFSSPLSVFPADMLEPEKQDMDEYVEGVENIVAAQREAARKYFEDGTVEEVCPPLKALLHILTEGEWKGLKQDSPEFRRMFTLEYLLESDWYEGRLKAKQNRDVALWRRHCENLRKFHAKEWNRAACERLQIPQRLEKAEARLREVESPDYWRSLKGTIGADPLGAF